MTPDDIDDAPRNDESLESKLKRLNHSVLVGELSNRDYEAAVSTALHEAPLDELTAGLTQSAENPDPGDDT